MHASICDFVSDLAQNAVEAGASAVMIELREEGSRLEVLVADDGKGMGAEVLKRVTDPFVTEAGKHARQVGLGLAFLRQAAEAAGGGLDIRSEPGVGTSICVGFERTHVDTPPMGDLAVLAVTLMNYPGEYELELVRRQDGRSYRLSRSALRSALGDLESVESLNLAKQYVSSLEEEMMK